MTQHDDLFYVKNMLDSARGVAKRATATGADAFVSDEDLQLVLAMLFQRIGEAARNISPAFRAAHADVPWHRIVGARHRIVHDYLHIDLTILWNVATESVPALIPQLEAILAEPNP